MRTSEVLNRAADLIEERGWTRGINGWRGGANGLCLEGAIGAAASIPNDGGERLGLYACPAYWAVANYLDRDPTPRIVPIKDTLWAWNDTRDRTAAEVIEVLRAAAVIEAAKESEPVTTAEFPEFAAVTA